MVDDETKQKLRYWRGGVLGGISILVGFMLTVSNNANIAISVAEQHGNELNNVRADIAALRVEISNRTQDRYTAIDAERDLRFVERRLKEIEEKMDREHKDMVK
jgi:hypothetical protein